MDVKETNDGKGKGILDGPTITVAVVFWILAMMLYFTKGTFWSALGASVLFTILCLPAAAAGNLFRRIFCPDFVITSGTGELVKSKIWWAIGPQSVAVFLALCISLTVVNSKEDIARERENEKQEQDNIARKERWKKEKEEEREADLVLLERIKVEAKPAKVEDWNRVLEQGRRAGRNLPELKRDELETGDQFGMRIQARQAKIEEERKQLYRDAGFEVGKYYRLRCPETGFAIASLSYSIDDKSLECRYVVRSHPVKWPFEFSESQKSYFSVFGHNAVNTRPDAYTYETARIPLTVEEAKAIRGKSDSIGKVPKNVDVVVQFPSTRIVMLIVTRK